MLRKPAGNEVRKTRSGIRFKSRGLRESFVGDGSRVRVLGGRVGSGRQGGAELGC